MWVTTDQGVRGGRIQHNSHPHVCDEYNLLADKLKIIVLIHGDERVFRLNFDEIVF